MNLSTYDFTELDAYDGLIVNGSADVSWTFEPDDPDVGYRGGYDFEVTRISIETPYGNTLTLDNANDLYRDIELALITQRYDQIIAQIKSDMEG